MRTIQDIITEATATGTHAANLEDLGRSTGRTDTRDDIHHLGDDTGKLITEAYRLGDTATGPRLAANVIDAYLIAFNERRATSSIAPLTPQHAIANLSWAIVPTGITENEQAEVTADFSRRH